MARQSLSAGHCRPPCHWIGATSYSSAIAAGRHRSHEECPPPRPPTAIPISRSSVASGLWERCFFSLVTYMSRTTLHIHMHICIAPRLTALAALHTKASSWEPLLE